MGGDADLFFSIRQFFEMRDGQVNDVSYSYEPVSLAFVPTIVEIMVKNWNRTDE